MNKKKIIYPILVTFILLIVYALLLDNDEKKEILVDEIIFEVELSENLKSVRDAYFEGANKIHNLSLSIIQNNSFKNNVKNLKDYNKCIILFYNRLLEIDKMFSNRLRIKGGYSDSAPDTSDEQFVQINRTMFIQNLEKLESKIMSIENEKKFRQTMLIAVFAIFISVFGIFISILL